MLIEIEYFEDFNGNIVALHCNHCQDLNLATKSAQEAKEAP